MQFVHHKQTPGEEFVRMDVLSKTYCSAEETKTPNLFTIHYEDPGVVWFYKWKNISGRQILVKDIYPKALWHNTVTWHHRNRKHDLQPPN